MERVEALRETLLRLHSVPMDGKAACCVASALLELDGGNEYITPFDLCGLSSVTPNEIRIIFESFKRQENPDEDGEKTQTVAAD